MQAQREPQSRLRQTVNELVMAEMFLVQATIESVSAIGGGISELGKQISSGEEAGDDSWETLSSTLQQIADDAVEPYTSRFHYFRDMINNDS